MHCDNTYTQSSFYNWVHGWENDLAQGCHRRFGTIAHTDRNHWVAVLFALSTALSTLAIHLTKRWATTSLKA